MNVCNESKKKNFAKWIFMQCKQISHVYDFFIEDCKVKSEECKQFLYDLLELLALILLWRLY